MKDDQNRGPDAEDFEDLSWDLSWDMGEVSDVDPVCGCHISARCPSCRCCRSCVGCHCGEPTDA